MQPLSNKAFIREFARQHSENRLRFCWILGSGASASSGIPMGRELATRWLQEMYDGVDHPRPKPSLKDWANETLKNEIPEFDYERAANFYPYIYREHYKNRPADGFRDLQSMMLRAEPEFGYKVLAQIMSNSDDSKPSRHNIAITTNFDQLIEKSIIQYTGKVPFVCGHELLAPYLIENMHHPVVAKIHRDLFLAPMSHPQEICSIAKEWKHPLEKIFERCVPIVIGFGDGGGSGGSLMQFLEELPPIEGGIYWCYREKTPGELPAKEVRSIINKHGGHLVPIVGFDELMFQLWEAMRLTSIHCDLQERGRTLVASYSRGIQKTSDRVFSMEKPDMSDTVESTILSVRAALRRLATDGF